MIFSYLLKANISSHSTSSHFIISNSAFRFNAIFMDEAVDSCKKNCKIAVLKTLIAL